MLTSVLPSFQFGCLSYTIQVHLPGDEATYISDQYKAPTGTNGTGAIPQLRSLLPRVPSSHLKSPVTPQLITVRLLHLNIYCYTDRHFKRLYCPL